MLACDGHEYGITGRGLGIDGQLRRAPGSFREGSIEAVYEYQPLLLRGLCQLLIGRDQKAGALLGIMSFTGLAINVGTAPRPRLAQSRNIAQ